jgi:hypothetical protein
VAARPANVDLLRRKLATATADGARFQALHVPRTPSSSTGSSPSSATRSLRGD